MSPLEIALIIIGVIVIAISCKLINNTKDDQKQLIGKSISSLEGSLTEADKKQLMEKLNHMVSEVTEEAIVQTDDALSKISNEKIMALHEFSDQVLEKIKRNHEEVVFLYNMLNDKEKELKSTVREIDFAKKKVQEFMEIKSENDSNSLPVKQRNIPTAKPNQPVAKVSTERGKTPQPSATPVQEASIDNSTGGNSNTQILELYSKGKSVVEISKLLGLGQGEVKLVIDLFKGKK